jgi:hypothetical protein
MDVGQEAHVEHPIGLIEHEDVELREPRVRESQMVQQTARRCDQDVDSSPKGLDLGSMPTPP